MEVFLIFPIYKIEIFCLHCIQNNNFLVNLHLQMIISHLKPLIFIFKLEFFLNKCTYYKVLAHSAMQPRCPWMLVITPPSPSPLSDINVCKFVLLTVFIALCSKINILKTCLFASYVKIVLPIKFGFYM